MIRAWRVAEVGTCHPQHTCNTCGGGCALPCAQEVIRTLQAQAKIEPGFTRLVWQKLEEQNREFFQAYHLKCVHAQTAVVATAAGCLCGACCLHHLAHLVSMCYI